MFSKPLLIPSVYKKLEDNGNFKDRVLDSKVNDEDDVQDWVKLSI